MPSSLTKLSFSFSKEDLRLLNSVKKQLRPEHGVVTTIAAMRYALRQCTKPAEK